MGRFSGADGRLSTALPSEAVVSEAVIAGAIVAHLQAPLVSAVRQSGDMHHAPVARFPLIQHVRLAQTHVATHYHLICASMNL